MRYMNILMMGKKKNESLELFFLTSRKKEILQYIIWI